MSLFVSTTGTDVEVPELGISIIHPTTDQDLLGQFSSDEISKAFSLTAAIVSGALVWRKIAAGVIQTPSNYDSDWAEVAELNTGTGVSADRIVTFKDLLTTTTLSKSGRIAAGGFTGTPRKATVTFATAFPNTNYTITVLGADGRSFIYESKLAASFVINAQANAALSGEVHWQAQADGESV